jgi:hypothetical protein
VQQEQRKQQEEERLDQEQRLMILRRLEWCCSWSYFHEGDPDLAAPPESQGSDENHLRQPCEQGKSLGKP